jgi:hypothetical protein
MTSPGEAERRLILLSAGTAARREAGREAALALAALVDWDALAATLFCRRLLPTLGPRVLALADGRAGGDLAAQVEHAIGLARRQGAFLALVGDQVAAALAAAGIRSAPLKGPALSTDLYGDPGRRLASDIDLLVAAEDLAAAVEVVGGLGYGEPIDAVGADGLPQLHFAVAHRRGELPPVELHWRIHWYERRFARERLLPPPGAAAGWRPRPAAELAALLLFYARDGFVDLRLATDLGAWWDRHGEEADAAELAALIAEFPALRRPLRAAAVAAEHVVGLPAAELLRGAPRLGPRERMAVRLADPNPSPRSPRSQVHAAMGLVDGLLAPPGELPEFVRRQVLLHPEVLDERAQKAQGSPRSRASHGARTLARIAVAGARVLRQPEAVDLAV